MNQAGMEAARAKAKQRRYKHAIVRDMNYETITQNLWEIQEQCENVRWYVDGDDDTLINALDGNEDEAYEFRMMFADLCAEVEQMLEDVQEEYIPDCFDDFFAGIGAGATGGGLMGYDEYEQDYFGLNINIERVWAQDEAGKRIMRLTKKELLEAAGLCFNLAMNYISLLNRYENLKAAMDILRGENTGYLQMVKRIEEIYDRAEDAYFHSWNPDCRELDQLLEAMPQEAFL